VGSGDELILSGLGLRNPEFPTSERPALNAYFSGPRNNYFLVHVLSPSESDAW